MSTTVQICLGAATILTLIIASELRRISNNIAALQYTLAYTQDAEFRKSARIG